jgi:hypothetical protein
LQTSGLNVRAILIRSAITVAGIVIAWLLGARQLSMLLDRLSTARLYSLPVSPLAFSTDILWIGDLPLDLAPSVGPIAAHVHCDSQSRAVMSDGPQLFALGVCATGYTPGAATFPFTSSAGDEVALTVSRSLISWPTPFDFNFMSGSSPTWRRNLYYRLTWKKASGANLTMVWRFEQGFYGENRWTSGTMTRAGSTGLLEVDIVEEQPGFAKSN